ncbi:hypothetical protein B0H16DRAFT_1241774, partial [Mycena metata]
QGSFPYDLVSGKYNMRWDSFEDFEEWFQEEQNSRQYPGIATVLGNYKDKHNHELGNANLRFISISKETREYIAGLLRMKVSPDHILHLLHRSVYDNDDLFESDLDDSNVASRAEFIQLGNIRRIEKEIEAESVRLHPDDGLS